MVIDQVVRQAAIRVIELGETPERALAAVLVRRSIETALEEFAFAHLILCA